MSEDIHKWTTGRYTLMFDEHTFFVWDNEKEKRMTALQVTKKLNEQQDTISALKEENDILKQKLRKNYIVNKQYEEMKRLQKENEQLRKELREKEEDEKLYANEIVELRKINEEWLQFKDLGGGY